MAQQETAQNRAAMRVAAGHIDDSASQIRGQQTNLNSHKDAVLVGWKGDAASAFGAAFLAFDEDMKKVLSTLDKLHESLVHNEINYQKNEESQKEAVNNIHNFINGF
ncbi:WXG100 family type VII secretion target [Actinoallomurus purpureus]|uniref:WXG100 family type VII secretion target n=1 Tax=Actinoallomurus purpureus TaxID=478114 RepID=UPI002091EB1C|nr:WXG100 family type VII secretion target [Actinoallomurus purpureus]MCO6011607.1 WXG100 family type VII secretion target [Actinoallomurus purpureus]